MSGRFSSRDLAFSGLFGAAALLLPAIFHVVHLGSVFMPMYIPLVALAFFVRPLPAALTALIVPLLSGVATGMPPLYPPVAPCMALELAAMASIISVTMSIWPRANELVVLVPVLALGRVLYASVAYACAMAVELPPGFVAGLSFLTGWPGVVLMAVVVPAVARTGRAHRLQSIARGGRMNGDPRAAYFDSIADQWDGWQDLSDEATARLASGLGALGLGGDETVIDVGCGTGNLTRIILNTLSPVGRVIAVDVSARMIERARTKVPDPRVTWHVADARRLPVDGSSVDRIVCYSVWPHFDDHAAVMSEFSRVLRPGGRLHVWHMISREMVNHIHGGAGPAVRGDMLAPAVETARLIESAGYDVTDIVDEEKRYLVSAVKRGR